jgi:hypothetical protein
LRQAHSIWSPAIVGVVSLALRGLPDPGVVANRQNVPVISLPEDQVAALPVDQLALVVLDDLVAASARNEYNYLLAASQAYSGEALGAIAEAVAWLRSRVLIARAPGHSAPLTDESAAKGEQEGMRCLFAGAYGVLRNPAGHREVDYDDVAEAAEAVLTASLLMRILDRVEARLQA